MEVRSYTLKLPLCPVGLGFGVASPGGRQLDAEIVGNFHQIDRRFHHLDIEDIFCFPGLELHRLRSRLCETVGVFLHRTGRRHALRDYSVMIYGHFRRSNFGVINNEIKIKAFKLSYFKRRRKIVRTLENPSVGEDYHRAYERSRHTSGRVLLQKVDIYRFRNKGEGFRGFECGNHLDVVAAECQSRHRH